MNKSTYYAIQEKQGRYWYAWAHKIENNTNLRCFFEAHPNIVTMNACDTKKDAFRIVGFWNECHKKNGVYMFSTPDDPLF